MKHQFRTLATALLLTTAAWAQGTADVSTAREIAKQGLQAYDAGDWATAEVQLGQAYAVVKVPTIALYRARALAKLGKLVEAAELYLEATRLEASGVGQEGQEKARQDARTEREALLPRIPKLIVAVEGVDPNQASVEIDGSAVPTALLAVGRLVNPGTHRVVGKLGQQEVVTVVTVAESETKTARVILAAPAEAAAPAAPPPTAAPAASAPTPTPAPEPASQPAPLADQPDRGEAGSTQRTLGWVGVTIGGAGLVVGGVTGLMASSQRKDLDDGGCQDGVCYDDQAADVDSYNQLRSIATVGFIVGGIGVLTGATLLLTAPSDEPESAEVRAWVGVASAGVAGRF